MDCRQIDSEAIARDESPAFLSGKPFLLRAAE
jgi:hypothetical protein